MTDIICSDHAAHWLFHPVTDKGRDWCRVHLTDLQWRGSWVVQEDADNLIQRMVADGVRPDVRQGPL
jgi:hypothetical protein